MEITKEQFEKYLKVQASGKYNMFDPQARQMSGLDNDTYSQIITQYSTLMVQYKDLYDKYMGVK